MARTFLPFRAPTHGVVEILHYHPCAGLGGGAKGFQNARIQLGMLQGRYRCIGGFDNNPAACKDFLKLTGVPLPQLDLFSYDQYCAYHGHVPPPGWREATVADIHRTAGYQTPNVIFASMPCKGFSGLLSQEKSLTAKYQALNALALRGIALSLEAFEDNPAEIILFENVPRIASRGRHFLDQIKQLFQRYGYASVETSHDCGEIGKLSQSRKRFLLVARHIEKVPPFLYEPRKHSLQPVSAVLSRCPLPGDLRVGPMHKIPTLNWQTWVRLAFVDAGKDWRCLQRLNVENGVLKDYAIEAATDYHSGVYGVQPWSAPAATIAGRSGPTNDAYSVPDPRIDGHPQSVQLGVRDWGDTGPTVTGQMWPGQGPFAVADPRPTREAPFRNVFRVVRWDEVSRAVTGGTHPTAGGVNVADPRVAYGPSTHHNKLRVESWDGTALTVTGTADVHAGALSVADPRTGLCREKGDHYLTAGHYGVVPWTATAYAVTASGQHDNGFHNVADPRLAHSPVRNDSGKSSLDTDSPRNATVPSVQGLPAPKDRLIAIIRAADGTWHRPFTTYELAALQSLIEPEEKLELDGLSDSAWRERIGNAVPTHAATAIAEVIGMTLLLAWTGETFVLGSTPIWVRDIAVALTLPNRTPLVH
jgi:site-specific DNA-cytosine methylase